MCSSDLATEIISYQMPAFKRRRVFFFFAAFKAHIGIYPPVQGDAALAAELELRRRGRALDLPDSYTQTLGTLGSARMVAFLDRNRRRNAGRRARNLEASGRPPPWPPRARKPVRRLDAVASQTWPHRRNISRNLDPEWLAVDGSWETFLYA